MRAGVAQASDRIQMIEIYADLAGIPAAIVPQESRKVFEGQQLYKDPDRAVCILYFCSDVPTGIKNVAKGKVFIDQVPGKDGIRLLRDSFHNVRIAA